MKFTILRFDSLPSTNTEAAEHARRGADEGLCIIAREQTSGRGRWGRQWVSDKDAGLYFSIILRPQIEARLLPLITLMTGVAVFDTLQDLGLKPDIKWVNDVLIDEKKICGILAETVETPRGTAVVVGIGVNLASVNFPDDLGMTATSIEAVTGEKVTGDEVAAALSPYISSYYAKLCNENGPAEIIESWRLRSTYFSGKRVRVRLSDRVIGGVTDGLEENGALRVRRSDGSVSIVQAGDVELMRADYQRDQRN